MTEGTQPAFDYSALQQDYPGMADMIIENFEQTCFDIRMENLLQGMLRKDWVIAMTSSHTLKGSAGYIKANSFIHSVKMFQEFIKEHCKRIEYPPEETVQVDRPQYELLDSFDDKKKLHAYELFHPIIQEARLLKQEMSKYTKSKFSNNIYETEGKQIQQMHKELIDENKLIAEPTNPNGSDPYIEKNSEGNSKKKASDKKPPPIDRNESKMEIPNPPVQSNSCCEKCIIF